ncbi:MAG TPA: hypothetical protein PLK78_16155 [Verrucomicrobiota bacterium]|nr:hypothetical protein [Verrucomicrobiota bacterium]
MNSANPLNSSNPLKVGQRITIFGISDMLANTVKQEATVREVLPGDFRLDYAGAPRGGHRLAVIQPRGKRKQYYLDAKPSTLIFEGWDLPVVTDGDIPAEASECGLIVHRFVGNACLNLHAPSLDVLRDYIEHKNLNPHFTRRDCVIYLDAQRKETLVYPDTPTSSAVVQRLRERIAA